MITATTLKTQTVKNLAAMAKRKTISGWHEMRKDELIKALVKRARSDAAKAARKVAASSEAGAQSKSRPVSQQAESASAASKSANGSPRSKKPRLESVAKSGPATGRAEAAHTEPVSKPKTRRTEKRLGRIRADLARSKDLSYCQETNGNGDGPGQDRLVVMVRDSYWLHAYWELTRQSVQRARAALGQHWHAATPVLRVSEVASDGATSSVRQVLRDIEIHGGVNNWYVDVKDPPKSFQLDIGYRAPDGKYLSLIRSNVVTTPQTNAVDAMDGNWAEVAGDFDRIYALSGGYEQEVESSDLKRLFEERLRRPMGSPMITRFGRGAQSTNNGRRDFPFEVEAELVVHGRTNPAAHLTVKGEPIRLAADGTFTVRFELSNRRQVLPIVACSPDGVEQRTIVLAVERNTKVMEPVIREPDA